MYIFKLSLDGVKDISDIEKALEEALRLVKEGFTSGDLANEDVDVGFFELTSEK